LIPDLAQDGQELSKASLSRIQIQLSNPSSDTGLFILNPNDNPVSFTLRLTDPAGSVTAAPVVGVLDVLPRGTYIDVQSSLRVLPEFAAASQGQMRMEVVVDVMPGIGERLIMYGVYRGQRFLSAVPAQR
jgi:hypothetical protein